jgi:uncharacterized protein
MDRSLERKLDDLRSRIRKLDSAIVAFSGGVDSSLLMRVCREELGDRAVAVTAFSGDYPSAELSLARRIAKVMGAKHLTQRMGNSSRSNSSLCKGKVYNSLKELASRMKLKHVLDGSHADDAAEKGFSFVAARQAGVRSPLLEVGLSKAEVRLLAKELGLPNWDLPASGCSGELDPSLQEIKGGSGFKKLQAAKRYMKSCLKIKVPILCKSGKRLKIILSKEDLVKVARKMDAVRKRMKSLGFSDVLLCLTK